MNEDQLKTRDMVLRAWQNSMEMVRDFENYSKKVDDEKVRDTFKKFAEEEGIHASHFRELMEQKYDG